MKESDEVGPVLHQQKQPPVMGHHHHHLQQQQPQILHSSSSHKSSPVPVTAMDVQEPVDNNINPMFHPHHADPAAVVPAAPVPVGPVSVQQFKELEDECLSLRENNMKMKQQLVDSQRRERLMMRRLAAKEQELLDYVNQVAELKAVQTPGQTALKTAMLDPAVNVLFQKLKQELQATQARLEETQNELAAWKFTPDSNTGKRLMAKCRLLHQENEELGKLTSNGRLAKLESELAMQKGVSEDLKKCHCELDEVLLELEEDVEGMQNTILLMQRELKIEKERNKNGSDLENGVEYRLQGHAQTTSVGQSQEEGHRVNGGMEVDSDEGDQVEKGVCASASAEPMDTATNQQLRTRSGGVGVSQVSDRTTASDLVDGVSASEVVHATNGSNGQPMMTTRKRTRSSVANSGNVVVASEDQAQHAGEEEEGANTVNCISGKRNRYSNAGAVVAGGSGGGATQVISDKSAPRTRGQLQMMESEKLAKLNEEEEGVGENGSGGGDEMKLKVASSEVLFSNSNNNIINNNNGSNKDAGGVDGEVENGTEAMKLKLENGSNTGGGVAGIDLRQENNTSV